MKVKAANGLTRKAAKEGMRDTPLYEWTYVFRENVWKIGDYLYSDEAVRQLVEEMEMLQEYWYLRKHCVATFDSIQDSIEED